MTLDAHHDIHMPRCTSRHDVPAAAAGDHLVQDAAEQLAAAHVADRHMIGIDHAGPFEAWPRLADVA